MCIVRNKPSDKLSCLAATVESKLCSKYELVYFVRESSWNDDRVCWIDGCIDGSRRVSFTFGENIEGSDGVYITISHEGGDNHITREYKLDSALEEQDDATIRTIASGISKMVAEYYSKANKN